MDYRLHLSRHGLFKNPFYKAENYFAAVQRGYWQKIEHCEIDPYICCDFKKALQALRGDFGRQRNGCNGPQQCNPIDTVERGEAMLSKPIIFRLTEIIQHYPPPVNLFEAICVNFLNLFIAASAIFAFRGG